MDQVLQKKNRCLGVLIGGSGLIGGTLAHYFKTKTPDEFDIRAPSSKKLSIRNAQDIIVYLKRVRPDFFINTSMASQHQSGASLLCAEDSLYSFQLGCGLAARGELG
jgi:hypothetical protein